MDHATRFKPLDYLYATLRFAEQSMLICDDEPYKYLVESNGVIEGRDLGTDNLEEVGAFSCRLIDLDGAVNAGVGWYEVFDTTQNTFDLYQDLYDMASGDLLPKVQSAAYGKANWQTNSNVLLIDRLVIYPEHRGHGVGLLVMRALMHRFSSFADLIVINPYPLQFESKGIGEELACNRPRAQWELESFDTNQRSATARLKRHYAKLGFKAVPKTTYMVSTSQNRLPQAESLISSRAGDSKSPAGNGGLSSR